MVQKQSSPPALAHSTVTRGLSPASLSSLTIAILLANASLIGLLYSTTVYPTEEVRQLSVANDLVNLVVVLPILLSAIWLARRGRLVGLLFWPGALFVVFYNSLAAVVTLSVNVGFLVNLLLSTLSVYTVIALVAIIDAQAVREQLAGNVPERLAGGALMAWGVLFALFVFGALVDPLLTSTLVPVSDRALHIADLMIVPALVIGGLLLWRRHALGYVTGVGLLFQVNMLFVGVIAVLLLQPLLNPEPLRVGDVVVLAAMWSIGLIPFVPFVRGI